MLRLNLGDLIEWEGAEYTVAATDKMATLLVRLADGRRIWVDLPSLAAAGDVSLRPIAGRTAGDGVGAGAPPLTGPEAERALWWQAHLTEVIHGVPNPDDASLTPRPGYEQASKTGRREVKARELHAAGGHSVDAHAAPQGGRLHPRGSSRSARPSRGQPPNDRGRCAGDRRRLGGLPKGRCRDGSGYPQAWRRGVSRTSSAALRRI